MSQKDITQHLEPTRRLRKKNLKTYSIEQQVWEDDNIVCLQNSLCQWCDWSICRFCYNFCLATSCETRDAPSVWFDWQHAKVYVRVNKCGSLNQESTLGSLQNQMLWIHTLQGLPWCWLHCLNESVTPVQLVSKHHMEAPKCLMNFLPATICAY